MTLKIPKAAVIITAAGSSQRMGIETKKEFLNLDDQPVLLKALIPFIKSGLFSYYIIVLPKENMETGRKILSSLGNSGEFIYVPGGLTRQKSVFNALLALVETAPDVVLIHDGARPWITETVVKEVYRRTLEKGAAIPVMPSVNAMKTIDSSGMISAHLQRNSTVSAQTPQGFTYQKILSCHKKAQSSDEVFIDDAQIFSRYGGVVATVPGDSNNRKITYPSDLPGGRTAL